MAGPDGGQACLLLSSPLTSSLGFPFSERSVSLAALATALPSDCRGSRVSLHPAEYFLSTYCVPGSVPGTGPPLPHLYSWLALPRRHHEKQLLLTPPGRSHTHRHPSADPISSASEIYPASAAGHRRLQPQRCAAESVTPSSVCQSPRCIHPPRPRHGHHHAERVRHTGAQQ